MANIPLGGQIQVSRKVASVDAKYGPYASKQAAQDALGAGGMGVIAVGLTVGIIEGSKIVEYWWQGGTTIEHLMMKSTDAVVDLKQTASMYLAESPKVCSFTYGGVPLYCMPVVHEGANYFLIFAFLVEDGEPVKKVYLIAGKTITSIYEGNEIPDWIISLYPQEMASRIAELDRITTWK